MAVYTTPTETHEHYVERDTGGSGAGVWAVIAVLIVLFALLFFGTNLFGRRGGTSSPTNSGSSIQTPSTNSNSGASGSTSGSASGSASGSVK